MSLESLTETSERESYMFEARSWSDTSQCVADDRQDKVVVFTPRRRGGVPVKERIDFRLAHGLPGKLVRGTLLTAPLKSYQSGDVLI